MVFININFICEIGQIPVLSVQPTRLFMDLLNSELC